MSDDELNLFDNDDEGEEVWTPIDVGQGVTIELQPQLCQIWGSAMNLARWVAAHPSVIRGQSVVELGAAAGLPCLVATTVGAAASLGTDVDANGVDRMKTAASRNGLEQIMRAEKLDWFEYLGSRPPDRATVDVVLAADVNYSSKTVDALLSTIRSLLGPQGTLLLASRAQRFGLCETLARLPASADVRLASAYIFDDDGDW